MVKIQMEVRFLSTSSSDAHFFLSPDFYELWHSVMSICQVTEVKQQCVTIVLGWLTTSVHYLCLMALRLALVHLFFCLLDFHELWCSVMNICSLK